jgi:RHS repeat-associated protein
VKIKNIVSKQTTISHKGHRSVNRLTRSCNSRWRKHRTKYNYDALGRSTNRAINGVAQQLTFDALGRVTQVTNALGIFSNAYVGTTFEISTNFYPNGLRTAFTYLSVTNDERLTEILNQTNGGGTISKFDYVYNPVGQLTNWTQQADAATPTAYTYQYDAGRQLLSSVLKSTGVGATILKQYGYGYDLAGNRTSEEIGTGTSGPVAVSSTGYNNVNQITNRMSGSGLMQFAGNLNERATVIVGGNSATVDHTKTNFTGYANVSLGTNVVAISATDLNGNTTNHNYQLVVTNNGLAKTITYDLNGNETSVVTVSSTNSYQWDAANRMVSITGPTNQSLFTYDGLGRRVQVIEKTNGVAYMTSTFVWCGAELCEQRDATGATVMKRFFGEGEQIAGVNYFFTRDHLGSVREVVNTAGAMQARYDYDPYGRMTVVAGSFAADFGYAGMYYHAPSGLNLTLYRAYDSDLGRWPNRDPIQELGGLNLYAYVGNNPINAIDLYGLIDVFVNVWNQSGMSVGHVEVVDMNINVLLSQFPATHAPSGVNTTFDFMHTLQDEGRSPDSSFIVHVPDDAKFNSAVSFERALPYWNWNPSRFSKKRTNCVMAAAKALSDGGVPVDNNYYWPGSLGDDLNNLGSQPATPSQNWSVTPVPFGVQLQLYYVNTLF